MSKYERISCHSFVEINGFAYFSNASYNGLFQVELKTGNTLFLGCFKNELQDEFNLHWESFRQEKFIYFLPRRGRHVHIYSLADRSVLDIEIRKKSEEFFRIGKVIREGEKLIFIPIEENAPIRKLDLITFSVENIDKGAVNGFLEAKNKAAVPVSDFLDKEIEKKAGYSWTQLSNGDWYAFLLKGRHLLKYVPEAKSICIVPLNVINEMELKAYLQPLRMACLCKGQLVENDVLTFMEYLETIVLQSDNKNTQKEDSSGFVIGDNIWKFVKN